MVEKNHGASRKRKKYIKEQLETLMLLNLSDETLKNKMRNLGIKEDDMNIQSGILCALVQQALHGNLKAYQLIRDQLGENPKDGEDKEHIEGVTFIFDLPRVKKDEREKLKEK